jgi:hypothetical protein
MLAVDALYEEPRILSAATGHHRIFAQAAYRLVRQLQFAPAVIAEAGHLARLFPLCWRRSEEGPVLVALRSLLPDGRGHASDAPVQEPLLPLTLQAFPLVVPNAEIIAQQKVVFDATIADHPSDIGAPLLMSNGKFSRAGLERARKAISIAQALPDTLAVGESLLEAGLLEPWPLQFDLGHGEHVVIEDLMVLSSSRLRADELTGVVMRHGVGVGLFLSLHRASLFRIGNLLLSARKAVDEAHRSATAPMAPG